ncbi:MAG: proline--tRNA ligase [Parcubacteria group bacterium]|nr:proline--tRNA ligase [Parcubacteria group bacterium]
MRQSQLFTKILKESPKDEISANAKLLERAGFIFKTMSGVYDYLPLGWRVLSKINQIIREEINAIGGQELHLSAFQSKDLWEKTGRWQTLADIMYQFKDQSGHDVGLATTHEEAVTDIAKRFIRSYKDLPVFVYQIQTKFRDEPRARSGLIRGKEFLMKDLYSFHQDEKDLDLFYKKVVKAYLKIFKRLGLSIFVTEASGGIFSKEPSHEFQALTLSGEDTIFYCQKCQYAQNREIATMKEGGQCPKCSGKVFQSRAIEVGNIFKLGTRFSEAIGLNFISKDGQARPAIMGSYGIGPGRAMGTIVEVSSDERGIIWPESVAPYGIHLIFLFRESVKKTRLKKLAEKIYQDLQKKNIEVLYDDREDKSAGEKFADADLIGAPLRIVVSDKTMAKDSVEIKKRNSKKIEVVKISRFNQIKK